MPIRNHDEGIYLESGTEVTHTYASRHRDLERLSSNVVRVLNEPQDRGVTSRGKERLIFDRKITMEADKIFENLVNCVRNYICEGFALGIPIKDTFLKQWGIR